MAFLRFSRVIAGRAQASRSTTLTHDLSVGQGAPDRNVSRFVAKILRFVRPMRDECAQILPRKTLKNWDKATIAAECLVQVYSR